jgi:hypothetical protein
MTPALRLAQRSPDGAMHLMSGRRPGAVHDHLAVHTLQMLRLQPVEAMFSNSRDEMLRTAVRYAA